MAKVSILIPARRETFEVAFGVTTLARTVQEVYDKAHGSFEVLVGFDGEPYEPLKERPGLRVFYYPQARGTKPVLNELAYWATGDYLFKLDAHCALSEGFDVELQSECGPHDVVTPRFYVLNPHTWQWQDDRYYDYFYLPCPLTDPKLYRFQAGGHWAERTKERASFAIDENMKLHGSSFLMRKSFWEQMDGLDMTHIDMSSGEDIEISLKAWLGPWDGRVMVNKRAWIAHMHKGQAQPRSWNASQKSINASYLYTANYWMRNQWKERKRDIDWLIDRFSPVPRWPADWREQQRAYERRADAGVHPEQVHADGVGRVAAAHP